MVWKVIAGLIGAAAFAAVGLWVGRATASAAPGATPPPVQLQGLSREVMLTPEPLVVEGRRPVRAGRRPPRPHRPNRFTRSRREDASELDE